MIRDQVSRRGCRCRAVCPGRHGGFTHGPRWPQPHRIEEPDRQALRDADFSDADIFDIANVSSLERTLEAFKLESIDDLLSEIGLGNRPAPLVARALAEVHEDAPKRPRRGFLRSAVSNPLLIRGTEGMVVSFPKCCYPIPGDPIVGILTAGRGIVIHQPSCSNVVEGRNNQDMWIDVGWAHDIDQEFNVELSLTVVNKRGVLATIAAAVADKNANIEDVELSERDERYSHMRLVVALKDRKHLADLIRKLRAIKTVVRVMRRKA